MEAATHPPPRRIRELPWLALSVLVSGALVSVLAWALCASLLAAQDALDRSTAQRTAETGQYTELQGRIARACADGSAIGELCRAPGR
jgi:hypothetical protein